MVDESTPILLICGDADPVSAGAKGVKKLNKVYTKHWLNVELKIYNDARHDILPEECKKEVFDDINNWLNLQKIKCKRK